MVITSNLLHKKMNITKTLKVSANKGLVASTLTSLLLLCSFSSQAISLTSYRLYLDNNNRTESFVMFSRTQNPEKCSIKLKHFNFDENGVMTAPKDKELPDNSAKSWIRYSPKNFTVNKNKPQTVRFSMRRKANTAPQEYRSYISISCDEINPEPVTENLGVSVKPRMIQNVPVIVRTGKLQAEGSFEDIQITENELTAKLTRTGNRSIYGRLALIDKSTNKELSFTTGISLYTETSSYAVSFRLGGEKMPPTDQLLLRFTEDEHYGGSLVIEKNVK